MFQRHKSKMKKKYEYTVEIVSGELSDRTRKDVERVIANSVALKQAIVLGLSTAFQNNIRLQEFDPVDHIKLRVVRTK